MLKEQLFSFLPEFKEYIEEENRGYLFREYIPGDTLWEKVNHQGPFKLQEANDIICRLCDMLTQFHEQEPPMIHRDIKPQNIVLTAEKNLFLIDLGTVREYKKTESTGQIECFDAVSNGIADHEAFDSAS